MVLPAFASKNQQRLCNVSRPASDKAAGDNSTSCRKASQNQEPPFFACSLLKDSKRRRSNPAVTSRCGGLLCSASADARSPDDAIGFEGLQRSGRAGVFNVVLGTSCFEW